MSAASKPDLHVIERPLDIADRLETAAFHAREAIVDGDDNSGLMSEAAALIRDLDKAISHAIAVKGSIALSPWAISVLHDAITRQKRRGGS
jgi:hypothetical protein